MHGFDPVPPFRSRLTHIRSCCAEPDIDTPSASPIGCKTPTHKALARMPDAPVVGVTAVRWSAAGEDTCGTDQL